jgi:hypothetical protein
VAAVELTTRTADTATGWRVSAAGGQVVNEREAGAPPGTSITVSELFAAVPARRKFLKSVATEVGQVTSLLRQEVIGLSLLASIPLLKFLSGVRTPTTTATFDKTLGSLTIERKWLWKQELINYSLADIQGISVIRKGSYGKAREYFKIWVQFSSGENLPLTPGNYRPEKAVEHRANKIREFLNFPS